MQHAACIDSFDIPWILQEVAFPHSSLWWEGFLNISNHLPVKWPMSVGQLDLIKPFVFAYNTPDDTIIQF